MSENNSWVKLFRKFKEWGWYSDINVSRLFLHLLLSVNYEDKDWKGVVVKRGQVIVGVEDLGEQTGLSRQQTRTALNKLKSTNEITTKSTNKYTVVTLVNWEVYQSESTKLTSKSTSKLTNHQPTTNQQLTTPKEYKNIRSKDIDVPPGEKTRAVKYVDYLNLVFGRKYQVTDKVIGNFKARIENDKYPGEVLRAVIDNLKLTTYHIDTKYGHCTPEFCLRQSTIEKYKSGPIIQKIQNGKQETPEPPKKQDQSKIREFYGG